MHEFIENEIKQYKLNGCNDEDLLEVLKGLKNRGNISSTIDELTEELLETSYKFLHSQDELGDGIVEGFSSMIYLPSIDGDYKLKFLGGKNNNNEGINDETLFDVASLTKMFTLLLTFKLSEYGFINLNDQIKYLDNRFDLEDFTINDLLLMHGVLYTNGNVATASNIEEAKRLLNTVYLKSNDKTKNTYTDFGMIVLSKVIEKVVSEKLGTNLTFSEIMDKYLLQPFHLDHSMFNPITNNLAGNGNKLGLVHDPKARILGGAVGSAGLFTNSDDLAKIAKEMYLVEYVNYNYLKNLITKENLREMGTIKFPNGNKPNQGLAGIYQQNPDREKMWLAPLALGRNTFTSQGFTGQIFTYDQRNGIHINVLANTIKDNEKTKPAGYMEALKKYQMFLAIKSMQLLILRKYDKMINGVCEVNKSFKI